MSEFMVLKGVRTHNLKDIEVSFPKHQLIGVSGMSGSGKSSLVFHTLHAESYRRYIDSLSSFSRQYLKAMPRPPIVSADHLLPSIVVKQATLNSSKRSTVGSLTEITDHLRVIFAHLCTTECVNGHGPLRSHSIASVARQLIDHHLHQRMLILARVSCITGDVSSAQHSVNVNMQDLLAFLKQQGFVRLLNSDGEVVKLSRLSQDQKSFDSSDLGQWYLVIDRVRISEETTQRLDEGLSKAFRLTQGQMAVARVENPKETLRVYKRSLSCAHCEDEAPEPSSEYFSYHHPLGACPVCQGYGQAMVWDWDKVIGSADTLRDLRFFKHKRGRRYREPMIESLSAHLSVGKKLSEYDEADLCWLKYGHPSPQERSDVVADGSQAAFSSSSSFSGLSGLLNRLNSHRSMSMKIFTSQFKGYIRCPECHGTRLAPWVQRYKINKMSFVDIQSLCASELHRWLRGLELRVGDQHPAILEALKQANKKIRYLIQIGLGYLSMDRVSRSLSGGEIQRIRMTQCLGSALSQTLYCLDEPTVGLHPLDTQKLMSVMRMLKDQGNTVVVVEHDPEVLAQSDWLIEMGPEAGWRGGTLCYQGPPQGSKHFREGVCLDRLSSGSRVSLNQSWIELLNVTTHNLKDVSIRVPIGSITGVCGVSGSGKSSLIRYSLYPACCAVMGGDSQESSEAAYHSVNYPSDQLTQVLLMSQKSLGRTMRSHIASYLGIWDGIRKLFAATADAKAMGWTARDFSLNTGHGRCAHCLGLGVVKEDMSFLGELYVKCSHCHGQRYKSDILEVRYQGQNIHQVLSMTVSEASEFFQTCGVSVIVRTLNEIMELGLGYLPLGQATSTFSGGEAQRLKILKLLVNVPASSSKMLMIFDEPTGGLSEEDIPFLWKKFQRLQKKGNTVVVVEHHLRVLKSVDWLIEMGPGAGDHGGEVVFQGVPSQLSDPSHQSGSSIARFLFPSTDCSVT